MYKKIIELSTYLKNPNNEISEIIKLSQEELNAIEEEKHKNRLKLTIVNSIDEEEKLNIRLTKEEKIKVNEYYYQRIIAIIEQMNRELKENSSDNDKISWIYNYVYDIPFFDNYGIYRDENGVLIPEKAKENYINEYEHFKFGVFDKQNLVLNKEKTGVCSAKAEFFKDLCDFACLNDSYCTTVSGIHMGVRHEWNAILNKKGVFYIDSSRAWHGKNSKIIQFMVTRDELKNKLVGYRDYKEVEYEYIIPRLSILNVRNVPDKTTIKKDSKYRIKLVTKKEEIENVNKK